MVLLALAVAPGAFWLWYFRARDRLRPEPRFLVRRVFILGGLAAFVAGLSELIVYRLLGIPQDESTSAAAVTLAAVSVGVVEEGLKFAAVMWGAYRRAEFNEVLDGIVYAVAASLGFATVENIFYVFEGGATVGIGRALLSVPAHAFFGALMGYYIGLAKFSGPRETTMLLTGLILAAIAHAGFDAVLFTRSALALLTIPLVLLLWRRAVVNSRRALALDNERLGPPGS